jgi:NADH:ubiquinone oxidoreductase subunit 4 (subunit M)
LIFKNIDITNLVPFSEKLDYFDSLRSSNVYKFQSYHKLVKVYLYFMSFMFVYYVLLLWIVSSMSTESYVFVSVLKRTIFLYNLDFAIGVDEISLLFIVLVTFIFLIIAFMANSRRVFKQMLFSSNIKELLALLILINIFLILTFYSLNFFYFFFFFESSLWPLVFLINIWGSRTRRFHASYFLLFFTLFGSILLLAGILILFVNFKTLDIRILMMERIDFSLQKTL